MLNIVKLFIYLTIFSTINLVKGVDLEFVEEGVLRKDGSCDIIFTNFGMDKYIKNLVITKIPDPDDEEKFSIKIEGLVNGNMGPNQQSYFDPEVLKDLIKVKQDGSDITDTSVSDVDKKKGTMSLQVNGLETCDGLLIKQTFKEPLITVANRLYYENVVPEHINQAFDSNKFGPSYDYPFERIHWKLNEGLDDLRETCGIYIYYHSVHESNKRHWQYYLSVENANTKNCSQLEYFEVIKRNYIDYHYTEENISENYMGYVLKREGHPEEHMDGVIIDNGYIIEIYQKDCEEQKTVCTIPSENKLSFEEFTQKLTSKDCLNIDDEDSHWAIDYDVATGKFKDQTITVKKPEKDARGSLPSDVDGDINYKTFSGSTSTPIARFVISIECKNGSSLNDECRCECKYIYIYIYILI